ncbi:unnamed protein product [Bemisia tabaci]|uniref:MADF domain-containing protein n=1 Tax=Bemisia tabaci TaxID=7038 RepID=A0A9P0FAC6_BEMTA|nr:unnamed protein product [Bemisia tabaci]
MVDWSNEEEFLLINLYEKFPVLWKSENCAHSSVKKYEAWREIAMALGKPVDEVEKKMSGLRHFLRWEKEMVKKLSQVETAGLSTESTSFAFKSLNFLTDGNKLQGRANSKMVDIASIDRLADSVDDEARSEKSHNSDTSAFANVTPNNVRTSSASTQHFSKQGSGTIKNSAKACPAACACSAVANNFSAVPAKDECDYFGSYVAGKLRNFDRQARAEAENQITKVLLRAEMDFGESLASSEISWMGSESFSSRLPSSTPHKNHHPRSFNPRRLAFNETCQPYSRSEFLPMSDDMRETTSRAMNAST